MLSSKNVSNFMILKVAECHEKESETKNSDECFTRWYITKRCNCQTVCSLFKDIWLQSCERFCTFDSLFWVCKETFSSWRLLLLIKISISLHQFAKHYKPSTSNTLIWNHLSPRMITALLSPTANLLRSHRVSQMHGFASKHCTTHFSNKNQI